MKSKLIKTPENPEGRHWPDEITLDVGSSMPYDIYWTDHNSGVTYIREDLVKRPKKRKGK